ncbi:site-specific DNA-methyltransferase [uncultured Helicobacter sp.]|uniref:site-specific DNA-methyltransferase n=1 Tax=uncultured Helicobacter sp. TaxID=175537 RepID=UPI0026059A70|nr:site-specific DNA-methyltransferase [uncultured Helicobacter sp.]
MAQLQWLGKEEVLNHHKDISYHTLDTLYTYPKNIKSNTIESKIIKGDNLLALKSLLPMYANKIQCIYIDPPYNTGSENWIYNDNVNSPLMQKWLSKVVNRDDLTRHDKWLCMMYPRLRLLHELLSENGVIFISIDDNEMAHLKLLCDEIFGERNFVADFIRKTKSTTNDAQVGLNYQHEFLLCYAKNKNNINLLGGQKDLSKYKNPDNDQNGAWVSTDPSAKSGSKETGYFPITNPYTQKVDYPPEGRFWLFSQNTIQKHIDEGRIHFKKAHKKDERGFIYKRYLKDLKTTQKTFDSLKFIDNAFMNQAATKEAKEIGFVENFAYPKPLSFIVEILKHATKKDSIILDSFAGSGTTAHAVLELNKQDNGNRKFILIECEDYADSITAQRVKHTINGYGKEPNLNATGGEFSFLEIGEPVLLDKKGEKVLNENLKLEKILEYIFYTEFDTTLCYNKEAFKQNYFVGEHRQKALYFIYEKHAPTTLNLEFIPHLRKQDSYLIYADKCTLSKEQLDQHNIEFKQIPRDIKDL